MMFASLTAPEFAARRLSFSSAAASCSVVTKHKGKHGTKVHCNVSALRPLQHCQAPKLPGGQLAHIPVLLLPDGGIAVT